MDSFYIHCLFVIMVHLTSHGNNKYEDNNSIDLADMDLRTVCAMFTYIGKVLLLTGIYSVALVSLLDWIRWSIVDYHILTRILLVLTYILIILNSFWISIIISMLLTTLLMLITISIAKGWKYRTS